MYYMQNILIKGKTYFEVGFYLIILDYYFILVNFKIY